jgi:hypothetical protein
LFLPSIVALDADDGSYVWHYQTTSNESWDYTATQPIMPEARYDRTDEPTFVMPSAAGGHSWYPMSMSPETGLVYISAMYSYLIFALYDEFVISPVASNTAVDSSVHYRMAGSPDLPSESRYEYGRAFLAWDPVAQKIVAEPVSYAVDGEQHVAVAVGSGVGGYYGPKNARLLAFKLGEDAEAARAYIVSLAHRAVQ